MALYLGENPIELYTSGSENGLTAFVHIKYATAVDYSNISATEMSTTANGAKYMGIYVDHLETPSIDPTVYNWTQISYDKDYLHLAYADDSSGTNFSTEYYAGASYLGISMDTTETASETYTDYSWIAVNPATSDFATKDYVDQNGGKIDTITVNGAEQTITNKTVNINLTPYAPLNGPTFAGAPYAPNSINNNSSRIATMDDVNASGGTIDIIKVANADNSEGFELDIDETDKSVIIDLQSYAPLENPILTGNAMADDFDEDGNNVVDANTGEETGARSRIATKYYVDNYGGKIDTITINNEATLVTINDESKNANLNLTSYPTAENLETQQLIEIDDLADADTLGGVVATEYATKTYVTANYTPLNDVRLTDAREPRTHKHDIADINSLQDALDAKSSTSHTHYSLLANGVYTISLPNNISKNDTFVLSNDLDNKITYGTTALVSGVSTLAAGTLYFQYEE